MTEPLTTEQRVEQVDEAWDRMFVESLIRSGVDPERASEVVKELWNGDWLEEWDDMTPEEAADECLYLIDASEDAE